MGTNYEVTADGVIAAPTVFFKPIAGVGNIEGAVYYNDGDITADRVKFIISL